MAFYDQAFANYDTGLATVAVNAGLMPRSSIPSMPNRIAARNENRWATRGRNLTMLPTPGYQANNWGRTAWHGRLMASRGLLGAGGQGVLPGMEGFAGAVPSAQAVAKGGSKFNLSGWMGEPAWKGAGFSRRTAGRYLAAGAFGAFAVDRAMATWDSARYRDPVGVAWNATLAAGAGYAAYHMFNTQSTARRAAIHWVERKANSGAVKIQNFIAKNPFFTRLIK